MSNQKPAYLRLEQIIGNKKRGVEPLVNISKSAWLRGVKLGRYPQPIKLSERVSAYRAHEIYSFIENYQGIDK